MLRVDLRDLQRGPVETVGDIQPADKAFEGLQLALRGPVHVDGRLQETGDGEYFWRARLTGEMVAQCRRCLIDVLTPLDADVSVLFSADPDAADDPSVYELPEAATHIDLAQAVREELALTAPAYVLCREDCAGLCPQCGADLNADPSHEHGTAEPV
jgi:uncharacterized protein